MSSGLYSCTYTTIWSPYRGGLLSLCITGEWHQYDDIICAEPSKSVLKRLKEAVWPDQRKNVIEGREIAGRVMLETIFDFLRSWTDINLRNFVTQLKQFHQIYGNPFVFEEKEKKWLTLNYTEKDVSNIDVMRRLPSSRLFSCLNNKNAFYFSAFY